MNETPFSVNKIDAASRQLQAAIDMIFFDKDPVAAHTLVGAASAIISSLTERHFPNDSWDKFVREANNLSQS